MSTALAKRIHPEARSRFTVRTVGETPVFEPRLPKGYRAYFTTRLGGGSLGPFAAMNLDPRSGQDPAVSDNRRRIAADTGRRLVSPMQVHGLRVVGALEYVEAEEALSRGDSAGGSGASAAGATGAAAAGLWPAEAMGTTPCDGLTLNPELDRHLAAVLLFADCLPVVLCGEVDMAVAHGGWRGVLSGVIQQAGAAMTGPPGAAVIGPSIGPCCFTVGADVAGSFEARFGAGVVLEPKEPGASPRVDLWEAATLALNEMGVPRTGVLNPRLCTVCNHDLFYSYRLEGPVTGRHGCVAWAGAA